MNKNIYRKTRYQNVYMNIKNRNYIIQISNPKTTISKIDGNRIIDLNVAVDYRNKVLKRNSITNFKTVSGTFEYYWSNYIDYCKNDVKMAYTTLKSKRIVYNTYCKKIKNNKIDKISKEYLFNYIDNLKTTNIEKNLVIKELRAFFNWCIKKEYLLYNPASSINKYKIEKNKMKYWLPEHLQKFNEVLNKEINSTDILAKEKAYLIKMLYEITFSLGCRVGETRALRFGDVYQNYNTIRIQHSIDYDPMSSDYIKSTKTYSSQRDIVVTKRLINDILEYKKFLVNSFNYNVTDDTLILTNPLSNKPYSDTYLRKLFYSFVDKANNPRIRMYDLRHTFVATMMNEHVDMYAISNRLGHTNIQTTINTYGHITENLKKDMANKTDKFF